ncbi:hypothetical protein D3C84_1244180 [compost metagenome]
MTGTSVRRKNWMPFIQRTCPVISRIVARDGSAATIASLTSGPITSTGMAQT